jgi:site-specific DNA-methyltransferase (adenine-specific)
VKTIDTYLDRIIQGDCIEQLKELPPKSIDVVFADPPYNLQLEGELYRPNMTKVDAVDDDWDKFESFKAYDSFTRKWLKACRRVLKDTGTLWVIGTYHNIYRVGKILMDLDYWILNEMIWIKTNNTPNFKGKRFANAHETLIWAQKHKRASYRFNYQALKIANTDETEKQMRSPWEISEEDDDELNVWEWESTILSRAERKQIFNGHKVHSTQKPEALLHRVIISSTNLGDVILDPFFGSGTTGAVAKKLRRHWIGIERDPKYVEVAQARIDAAAPSSDNLEVYQPSNKPKEPRLPFIRLLESGLLQPGQELRLDNKTGAVAVVAADGALIYNGQRGSIHQISTQIMGAPCNGWAHWHYHDAEAGEWRAIDTLRQKLRG